SVTSHPSTLVLPGAGPSLAAPRVRFASYTNYGHFIERSEIRIFERGASPEAQPLAVIPVDEAGRAEWEPDAFDFSGPVRELQYVLRAVDVTGRFDETSPQQLWLTHGGSAASPASDTSTSSLLAAHGESGPLARSIPLGNVGSVSIRGSGIPPHHTVSLAGTSVPVDEQGRFAADVLLPTGLHTVEVAVLDEQGNGELFLRDFRLPESDWFYAGVADVTLSTSFGGGPADALTGKNAQYDPDSLADGRLAFFVAGKFGEGWGLTASADTREGPLADLFSNFLDKSPAALFRRMDPDVYLPTFGDDGTVTDAAPTSGKFYAKLTNGDSHLLWGNFHAGYLANELAQVDRGLYGANARYQSLATTGAGETRIVFDAFAADPGTVASRDEFRVTGGSLYWLNRQDLLVGSERLRLEVRDKDSGIVSSVVHLRPTVDYDIDYLQGRVLLSEPVATTAEDSLLVRSQGLSGNEVWLVIQYEYTPGFTELDALAFGGQGEWWLNDHLLLGATANHNQEGGADSSLYAGHATFRKSADSWIKLQAGRSDGLVSSSLFSNDGGFSFFGAQPALPSVAEAGAYRAELSVGLGDFFDGRSGRVHLYGQLLEAGYSAPGQTALTDTNVYGGHLALPLTPVIALAAKADSRTQEGGLETTAGEVDLAYRLTSQWTLSGGVRSELREDGSPLVAVTQQEGNRTDAVVQADFAPGASWRGYAFAQGTLAATGSREDNHRGGIGGAQRIGERLVVEGEVSHGELGPAARVGTSYQESERSRRYVSYALDNELPESGLHQRRGNLISGARTRLSDSGSVFIEDRYQHTDEADGMTRSMGISFAPVEHWSVGGNWAYGTLFDRQTAAETKRTAGGARVGYAFQALQLSSGVEYRFDETEQSDGSWSDRKTWLFRNSLKLQVRPSWQVVGKFNHSFSDSSLGDFYGGDFTEAVLGYAYRPVEHDRLNALAKYTYFYNLPTAEQVTAKGALTQFLQRSHVASLDLSFDVTKSWSVGGKYAYRLGEVSLDRENPQFFDNSAQLFILRNDLRFRKFWEASLEARLLDMRDLNERRSGALIGISRYLGEHFKVGVGYNFADFSDDLTDLTYDDHGLFLNLVGSL
ncbi:MAG TPA: flagellar motor protein MotB, partial [Myxococcota bacterium]|nr:flagellar motor protein MotB [Myxococcota bacterium]